MQASRRRTALKRSVAFSLLILVFLSLAPRAVLAQDILRGDQLPAGEVVDNDVILFGDEVRLAGTVKGNAFVSGRDVVIDGHIEGSLFTLAQRVTINGTVDGGVFVLSVTARLNSEGRVGQNLYFVGVSVVTQRGATIGRDLNGLTLGAVLAGSVGRETRLIAGLVQFIDLAFDIALGPAPNLLPVAALAGRAPGLGQIALPGDVTIDLIGQTTLPAQTAQPEATQNERGVAWLRARLRELLILLVVGLAGYWFLRRPMEAATAVIRQRPFYTLGVGLVGLVLAGGVVGAFILVFVLILMTGIWIGRLNLWNIGWLFWSLAFPFAALLFALLLAFLNHGTKVVAAYAFTTFALRRLAPRAGRYRWLSLLLGLVVYVFLRAIPILGWVIGVLVTAWGIGAAWLAWRGRTKQVAAPVTPTPLASDAPPSPPPDAPDALAFVAERLESGNDRTVDQTR